MPLAGLISLLGLGLGSWFMPEEHVINLPVVFLVSNLEKDETNDDIYNKLLIRITFLIQAAKKTFWMVGRA